jgi:threonine synthase
MRYVSTRGQAPELGFADVLLTGLAPDGGLYVPAAYPTMPLLAHGMPYADAAAAIITPFVGDDLAPAVVRALCHEAYASFGHPAVCPLVQIGDEEWVLELFHGPTLAFKDVALQLVGRMFDLVLGQRGRRVAIVGATSGDTGSAAIDGVKGCDNVDIVILYPHGRTSDVQRRQMTTVDAPNVHAVAVEGTFDDCQDLVKAMFADEPFRARLQLGAVNSINWARVMAQIVYYATSAMSLGGGLGGRPVSFAVPTGNFGNIFAGWVASEMGLPVTQLVIGSNRNDILTRFLHSGLMHVTTVVPTLSPSMDIQVSSNFERLLFELNHGDGGLTAEQMHQFRSTGSLILEPDQFDRITSLFSGARVDDAATVAMIGELHRTTGMLVDPHTAVGIGAGRVCRHDTTVPMVALATAHPAKFPDAVEQATGSRPPLPVHLADLFERRERTAVLPNDLAAVQRFVERAVAERSGTASLGD